MNECNAFAVLRNCSFCSTFARLFVCVYIRCRAAHTNWSVQFSPQNSHAHVHRHTNVMRLLIWNDIGISGNTDHRICEWTHIMNGSKFQFCQNSSIFKCCSYHCGPNASEHKTLNQFWILDGFFVWPLIAHCSRRIADICARSASTVNWRSNRNKRRSNQSNSDSFDHMKNTTNSIRYRSMVGILWHASIPLFARARIDICKCLSILSSV